jgi:hypothetical protein
MTSPKDTKHGNACDESRHILKYSQQLVNILRNSGRRDYQNTDSEGERRIDEGFQPRHLHPTKPKSAQSRQRIQLGR